MTKFTMQDLIKLRDEIESPEVNTEFTTLIHEINERYLIIRLRRS